MTDFHDTVRILLFNSDRLKAPLNTSTDSSDGLSLHFADNPSKFTTTETSPGIVRAQKRGAIFTLFLPLFFSFSLSLSLTLSKVVAVCVVESARCLRRSFQYVVKFPSLLTSSLLHDYWQRGAHTGLGNWCWMSSWTLSMNCLFRKTFIFSLILLLSQKPWCDPVRLTGLSLQ